MNNRNRSAAHFYIKNLGLAFLTISLFLWRAGDAAATGSAGFELALNSAKATARGGGAVVADAEDPSTLVTNPAGLSKLDGVEVLTNLSLVNFRTDYQGINGGQSENSASLTTPVPSIFVSVPTEFKELKLGFGVNAPFGLKTQYSSVGNFRYNGNYAQVKTVGYNAGASYEVTPWLAVGGGFTYLDASIKQVGKLNAQIAGVPDASFELDEDGFGTGWNMGALITPDPNDAIGLFYRSQIRTAYRGEVNFDNLQGAVLTTVFGGSSFKTSADTDLAFPDNFTVGWDHRFNDKLDVETDLTWTGWSSFDRLDIAFGTTNAILNAFEPINENFNDTFSLQIGATYKLSDRWDVSGGFLHYEMATKENFYSNTIPDYPRNGLTLGVGYNTGRYAIELSYLGTINSPVKVDNTVGNAAGAVVDGKYTSMVHIISISLLYKF